MSKRLIFGVFLSLLLWMTPALALKVTIIRLKGSVLVYLPSEDRWVPARTWMDLPRGAEIRTLASSMVDLLFERKALVRVKEKSLVKLGELSQKVKQIFKARHQERGTLIRLKEGRVYLLVRPDYPEKPFVVETPIGMAGVTGTRFVVHLLGEEMFVGVWQGHVRVWDPARERIIDLRPGQYCLLSRLRPVRPEPLSPELKERYQEVKKLFLPEDINWRLRSPGSRYEGSFTRGFAPEQDLEEREPDFWEFRTTHHPSSRASDHKAPSGAKESMKPTSGHLPEGFSRPERPGAGDSMPEAHMPGDHMPTDSRPEKSYYHEPRSIESRPHVESSPPRERVLPPERMSSPLESPSRPELPSPEHNLPSHGLETPSQSPHTGGKPSRR
ncbi:MAG: hypothetical protein GXO20_00290 [Thermodesulfobacteria bacterium]|nr:hypothetical protein [Thermodesulfobacteriota bacterium]